MTTHVQTSAANAHSARKDSPARPQAFDGALLGKGAVLIWNDVVEEGREQFYQWHDKEHIPERLGIPGFRRGRRYARPGHSPEWLTVYEADDLGVVTSPAYLARLNAPSAATSITLRYFRNTSRAVCRVVHSVGGSNGAHVLAMRMTVSDAHASAMCRVFSEDFFPRAMTCTGVVACHLYATDRTASHANTAESSTRTFDVPPWVVLFEMTRLRVAEDLRAIIEGPELLRLGIAIRDDAAIYSLEISRLGTCVASSNA